MAHILNAIKLYSLLPEKWNTLEDIDHIDITIKKSMKVIIIGFFFFFFFTIIIL